MMAIQLTHELEKLMCCMNGVPVYVQNKVAALQTGVRCGRSDLDLRHYHSILSRQTGNAYSPNFDCPLQGRRRCRHFRTLNGNCLGSAVSKDFDEERLS